MQEFGLGVATAIALCEPITRVWGIAPSRSRDGAPGQGSGGEAVIDIRLFNAQRRAKFGPLSRISR